MMFEQTRPDIPGTIYASAALYNLQTGDYILSNAGWSTAPWNKRLVTTPIPGDIFNPQSMAAQDQY
jgi:hypothetical protein